ncbi:MAG: hydrogenase [Methanomassiliicoccales archaeon]|nr:hydrogenase [Methanomassiliicoccales archaeon]
MSRRLPTGKVPAEVLRKLVFPYCGVKSDRVIQGPGVGEDAAVLDMGDKALVVKANPITGAESRIGWIAVHVNANDVATCGAQPRWFVSIVLLPEGAEESLLENIMKDIHEACCDLGISLIGGHTESAPKLDRPIIAGFMMGEIHKEICVTTGGARPSDVVILTKGAGIEGTGILATDLEEALQSKVSPEILKDAAELLTQISVVREALLVVEVEGIHSLHTPTEGGILNGIWEMTEAAGVGVRISERDIPIAEATKKICETLDVDPLKLMASGALIIVADKGKARKILANLEQNDIKAAIIGEIVDKEEGRILNRKDESRIPITAVDQDEVYRILDEHNSSET